MLAGFILVPIASGTLALTLALLAGNSLATCLLSYLLAGWGGMLGWLAAAGRAGQATNG